jgi:hypothetical protein
MYFENYMDFRQELNGTHALPHVTSTVRPLFPHPPCFGAGLRGRDMCSFKVHVLTLSPKYMYLWTAPPSVFLAPVGLLDTLRALLVLVSLLYCRPWKVEGANFSGSDLVFP